VQSDIEHPRIRIKDKIILSLECGLLALALIEAVVFFRMLKHPAAWTIKTNQDFIEFFLALHRDIAPEAMEKVLKILYLIWGFIAAL